MPEFILDRGDSESAARFSRLDSLTQGYIEALFFTEHAPNAPNAAAFWRQCEPGDNQGSFPEDCTFEDLTADSLKAIESDCAAFRAKAAELLEAAAEHGYTEEQAGRDFWFTRNGHGVGFWDRNELENNSPEYERLTAEMVANRHDSKKWDEACAARSKLKGESLGEKLSAIARAFGEMSAYFGDDEKIHVT